MNTLCLSINMRGRSCLIVGGGKVATRRAWQLLEAGAKVSVVSPRLDEALRQQHEQDAISYFAENYHPKYLQGMYLVVAATNSATLNATIAAQAIAANIEVNVVDAPELSTVLMPSIIERSPLQVAIFTQGTSSTLSRTLRTYLEAIIPKKYGELASLVADFKQQVKQRYPRQYDRSRFWRSVLDGPISEMLYMGRSKYAIKMLRRLLSENMDTDSVSGGEVYLVGSGPGAVDLLTFRAMRLIQKADVVLYDRLVSTEILNMVRQDAQRIYVGKQASNHSLEQLEINQLLVKLAKQGKNVLRLKGGDPFIFGRGGEEIELLAQQGIPFQVVPGITAANGCAAYAGIPLTHRDYAQSCVFVTGHLIDGDIELSWSGLAQPKQTLVIYMGLHGVTILCRKLIQHGLNPAMPAAIVQHGTTSDQCVYTGVLEDLPKLVKNHKITPPGLIIIGEVVSLRKDLSWFDGAWQSL